MIQTKEREIQGLRVTSVQYPAMTAYKTFARLGAILGPALATLGISKLQNLDDEIEGLPQAIGVLLGKLTEDTPLVLELLKSTSVVVGEDRLDLMTEQAINKAFSGNFLALLLTIKFAIEVNFSDFLSAGLALLPAPKEAEKTAETPQK